MAWTWNIIWLFLAFTTSKISCEEIKVKTGEYVNRGTRIVSGWEARPGEHPHHAIVRMVSALGGVGSCDGSIVHQRWALTAAHCLTNQVSLVVRAGLTNLTEPEYIAETSTFYIHPDYDQNQITSVQGTDIALIRLETPVKWSDRLRPIRIQSEEDAFRNYDGERVYASGFGRTWTGGATSEVLNWVYLTAISNERCVQIFGDSIRDTSICAGYYNVTSQSICQGDDGGPLVHADDDGIPTLIGISSFVIGSNFGGCHSGHPGGFVRTGPFLPWMREIAKEYSDELELETTTTTETPTTTEVFTTTELPKTTEELTTTEGETTTDLPTTADEEDEESGLEESEENDPELADLLKRMEVKVLVKVKMEKLKKKKTTNIHH